jgi:hypothetical protein
MQRAMASCSKGAWGLFVLSRGLGILTETAISPSTWSRQCPSRYAIRAGRNLPDKEFRYLRTVIVTAAVYRGFGSERRECKHPLTPPLNLPAPGRRQCVYGALRGLARTCVFAKQSLGPIHCGSAEPRRAATPRPASLLPKLRDQYAEFLDHVSLVHLRLLASPTCVGLRYGRQDASPGSFSRVSTPEDSPPGRPRGSHSRLGGPRGLAYAVGRPSTWPLPLRSTVPPGFDGVRRGRNLRRLSIGYASGASP